MYRTILAPIEEKGKGSSKLLPGTLQRQFPVKGKIGN